MDMISLTEIVILGGAVIIGSVWYLSKKIDNLTAAVLYWRSRCIYTENQVHSLKHLVVDPAHDTEHKQL